MPNEGRVQQVVRGSWHMLRIALSMNLGDICCGGSGIYVAMPRDLVFTWQCCGISKTWQAIRLSETMRCAPSEGARYTRYFSGKAKRAATRKPGYMYFCFCGKRMHHPKGNT